MAYRCATCGGDFEKLKDHTCFYPNKPVETKEVTHPVPPEPKKPYCEHDWVFLRKDGDGDIFYCSKCPTHRRVI